MSREFDLISDLHKDARGFRPSQAFLENFNSLPPSHQEAVWKQLQLELEWAEENARSYETRQLADFKAMLQKCIDCGAGDFATALRWAMDDEEDVSYFLYKQGIESSQGYAEVLSWGIGYEYRGGHLLPVREAA